LKKTEDSSAMASWQGETAAKRQLPTLNYWLSKIVKKNFLSQNFRPQMQNLGLRTPIWKKIIGKIKILSIHNLLCRKFAVSLGKFQFSAPPTHRLNCEKLAGG